MDELKEVYDDIEATPEETTTLAGEVLDVIDKKNSQIASLKAKLEACKMQGLEELKQRDEIIKSVLDVLDTE